jgi:hypothetical protein
VRGAWNGHWDRIYIADDKLRSHLQEFTESIQNVSVEITGIIMKYNIMKYKIASDNFNQPQKNQ